MLEHPLNLPHHAGPRTFPYRAPSTVSVQGAHTLQRLEREPNPGVPRGQKQAKSRQETCPKSCTDQAVRWLPWLCGIQMADPQPGRATKVAPAPDGQREERGHGSRMSPGSGVQGLQLSDPLQALLCPLPGKEVCASNGKAVSPASHPTPHTHTYPRSSSQKGERHSPVSWMSQNA